MTVTAGWPRSPTGTAPATPSPVPSPRRRRTSPPRPNTSRPARRPARSHDPPDDGHPTRTPARPVTAATADPAPGTMEPRNRPGAQRRHAGHQARQRLEVPRPVHVPNPRAERKFPQAEGAHSSPLRSRVRGRSLPGHTSLLPASSSAPRAIPGRLAPRRTKACDQIPVGYPVTRSLGWSRAGTDADRSSVAWAASFRGRAVGGLLRRDADLAGLVAVEAPVAGVHPGPDSCEVPQEVIDAVGLCRAVWS